MGAPTDADERRGWVLVGTQFLLLGVIGVETLRRARRASALRVLLGGTSVALGLAVLGRGALTLGRDLRAHPAPAEAAALRVSGPYRWVRHPIYSGLLAAAAGASLAAGTRSAGVALAGLVALLQVKTRFEERLLRARFAEYDAYAARTPRFLPRIPGRQPRRA